MTNFTRCFHVVTILTVVATGAVVGTATISGYSEISERVDVLGEQADRPVPVDPRIDDLVDQLEIMVTSLNAIEERLNDVAEVAEAANERSARIGAMVLESTEAK